MDDDEDNGISGARDLEVAQVAFEPNVAQGEEELGVVVVEDLVRDAGSVDTAEDLDVGTTVGCRKVAGVSSVADAGGRRLERRSVGILLCLCSHLG